MTYDERTNDNRQVFPIGPKSKAFLVIDGPVTTREIGILIKYIELYAEGVAEDEIARAVAATVPEYDPKREAVIAAARAIVAAPTVGDAEAAEVALTAAVHALDDTEGTG